MKTVLVIGGSSGIGNALVKNLAENNKVYSISRTPAMFVHKNVSEFLLDVLKDELPELEQLDALVYCPGSIQLKPFQRFSEADFTQDFEINVLGAIRVIQKYFPNLKKGNDPAILLFSTVAVKMGMPFHTSIATAKGAVEGLVKSLAAEFAPTIRVNAIAPTLTDTPLAAKILRNEAMKVSSAERHPLKKYLQAEEVAEMANFLISEKAKSITGQIQQMDCGLVTIKL